MAPGHGCHIHFVIPSKYTYRANFCHFVFVRGGDNFLSVDPIMINLDLSVSYMCEGDLNIAEFESTGA